MLLEDLQPLVASVIYGSSPRGSREEPFSERSPGRYLRGQRRRMPWPRPRFLLLRYFRGVKLVSCCLIFTRVSVVNILNTIFLRFIYT